jgi:hypothetical protein
MRVLHSRFFKNASPGKWQGRVEALVDLRGGLDMVEQREIPHPSRSEPSIFNPQIATLLSAISTFTNSITIPQRKLY